jgi:hypothetical protein
VSGLVRHEAGAQVLGGCGPDSYGNRQEKEDREG